MSVTVLNPGLLTTVQDLGRTGYQQFGVPVSGVMDPRSAAIANILVGNPQEEAVLECTLMGPHLRFDRAVAMAITGGDLGPTLDGRPIPGYRAISVQAGQVLRFTGPKTGCRAFVAFAGGLDLPLVMGSRSTYLKAGMGGFQGRKLEKGDVLPLRAPRTQLKNPTLRFLAPEGWQVDCAKNLFTSAPHSSFRQHASAEFTIHAGEQVEAVNRIVLEIVCAGRPTPLLAPIQIMG